MSVIPPKKSFPLYAECYLIFKELVHGNKQLIEKI